MSVKFDEEIELYISTQMRLDNAAFSLCNQFT